MHHHPELQADDFGVWAIELDFGIRIKDGQPEVIVGHNGECGEGCWTHSAWGPNLENYFERIRNTKAFSYRPVFIFLEKKDWGDKDYDDRTKWIPEVEKLLKQVFGDDRIFGPEDWFANNRTWPTIPDLAGKVVPIAIVVEDNAGSGKIFYEDDNGELRTGPKIENVTTGLKRVGPHECADADTLKNDANDNIHFLAADVYQYDYTFLESVSRWASPNPIVVDWAAPPQWTVRNDEDPLGTGKCWEDNACFNTDNCTHIEFSVSQHGTFRFPYNTVNKGVNTAMPGWTVLIKAGNYPETITITKPLTLKADGGTVVIGSH
jgi:hypothetical protein